MYKINKAEEIYLKIKSQIDENNVTEELKDMVGKLGAEIEEDKLRPLYKDSAWYHDARCFVALCQGTSEEKLVALHPCFEYMRHLLVHYINDLEDINDEKIWNNIIDDMNLAYLCLPNNFPGKYEEGYNNILIKRNFIEAHTNRLDKKIYTWKDIQNNLGEDEAAIEISIFPPEALIVKKNINEPIYVPLDPEIGCRIDKYKAKDPLTTEQLYSDGVLTDLWNLFSPFLSGIKTIYFSSDCMFQRFNFEAIKLNDSYVGDMYDFHLLQSTADLIELKQRKPFKKPIDVVLFGGINYENSNSFCTTDYNLASNNRKWELTRGLGLDERGSFGYLPYTLFEVESIKKILYQQNVKFDLYTGENATESMFRELSGHSPDIIHISTHGFFLQNKRKMDTTLNISMYGTLLNRTGVLMAGANKVWECQKDPNSRQEDGILTSLEISELDFSNTKLAVLSSCESGLGFYSPTGAVFGLQNALKSAGVETILMSLWKVNDEATSVLMNNFYIYLLSGDTPKCALKKAQKQLIANGFSSYYYWAAFVVLE